MSLHRLIHLRIDGQDVVEAVPQSSVVAFGKSANQFGSDHPKKVIGSCTRTPTETKPTAHPR